jgi:hypothetical protein
MAGTSPIFEDVGPKKKRKNSSHSSGISQLTIFARGFLIGCGSPWVSYSIHGES